MVLPAKLKEARDIFKRLFQKNKYERLIADYEALAAQHPEDMRIRVKIAETYLKCKNIDHALAIYQEIASHYESKNFTLKAVAIYKNMLKLDPTQVEINVKLAELFRKLEMIPEATNQYRIILQHFTQQKETAKQLDTALTLVSIDPSNSNRRKLAEIYQAQGIIKEAIAQYEILAQNYLQEKKYDELLRVYEILLAHNPKNHPMIKDVCILYLRRQEPDNAIRTLERYKVDLDPAFSTLTEKAKLMKKALRGAKPPAAAPTAA